MVVPDSERTFDLWHAKPSLLFFEFTPAQRIVLLRGSNSKLPIAHKARCAMCNYEKLRLGERRFSFTFQGLSLAHVQNGFRTERIFKEDSPTLNGQ